VHRRQSLSLLLAAFVALCAAVAGAQYTRDAAAKKKIQEAINNHYLATDFAKAEAILVGTINACEDKCSPQTLCEAWMYVGIVRGSGKNDQKGAMDAFVQAVTFDPKCKLDTALATPQTQTTYASAGGAGAQPVEDTEKGGKKKPPATAEDAVGNMVCTPEMLEVETRRPIPVSCSTDEDAVSAELKYREFGGDQWQTLKMRKKGDEFQAEIPCGATQTPGTLRVYVRAKDAAGDMADSWGSRSKPVEIQIVQQSDVEPPAFPDQDAPDRCAEKEICPPGLPGCEKPAQRGNKGWGATCEETVECESGLVCTGGQCEQAPSCDVDADCSEGKCVGGYCDPTAGGGGGGPYKKNWFGIHVAQDWAFVSGSDVCSFESQANSGFACFNQDFGTQFGFDPLVAQEAKPGIANAINPGGFVLATTRFLLSYDRAFTPNITIGARAGYAIRGGPAPAGGASFLPVHAELRGAYWFGSNALGKKGFRPYVHVGGGMAQVDAKLAIKVIDCGYNADSTERTILAADDPCLDGPPETADQFLVRELDAYKKLGQGFATAGGGVVFAFKDNMGVQLNLNAMLLLPSSGFVLEPSLGFVYGL
jgi:hypothetical protein